MDASSSREAGVPAETVIRPAREADVEQIFRVHSDSIRALCRERYAEREIAAWIAFLAEWQGQIVGFGQLDPRRGEIEACYVAPEAVGSGIGAALLHRMEEEAQRRGHAVVHLNATLNAESFYARMGYRWLGPARHRVAKDVELDCVRMEKTLARP
jgi:putative acetyltransferase